MGDNIVDKAKEKLEEVRDKLTDGEPKPPGRDDSPTDPDHEARLKAAAATGGTPDIPVGTEEGLRRDAGTDPAARPGA
jgi:hypothetical protein